MIFRLLGPLEVVRRPESGGAVDPGGAERVVDLGPRKQRAVLAVLLLHRGRVVSTDRLIDALWQGDAPASAMASIQAYISNLRRALRGESGGTSPIVRQPPGYVLDIAAEDVDLSAFLDDAESARRHADAAEWELALTMADRGLASVRGHLLEDLSDEPWVVMEAAGFEEVRTECRETRITALLALGRLAPALIEAAQLCSEFPFRDRTCWLRMLALHRAGRSSEALEQFGIHAARLDTELGLRPGTELVALQGAILRHEPGLAAWPRTPGWTGAEQVPAPASVVTAPEAPDAESGRVFVGSMPEAGTIDQMLDDVRGGAPRWLVLTGPAGIGKTRLAEECDARTTSIDGTAVWARCLEDDGAPAWWPIRRLLRELGADADAVLIPPTDVEPDEARFAVYERVAGVIESAASGVPALTVVVDDIQWADPTSLRCLMYLVGALHRERVWFVLTLRDSELTPTVRAFVDAVLHREGNRHIVVPALAETEVAALASHVCGERLSATEARVLAERTGGNPLFVSEYARLPRDERLGGGIPMAVRSVLGRRLTAVEPAVLQVLRVAAVIGDTVEMDILAAATRLDLDTLADYIDDAADERILVADPGIGGYAFAHGLLRDEVLAAIPELRRQRIHARIAEVLADSSDPDRSSRRAQHLMAALPLVDPRTVLDACTDAARVATERWSSETAAQWWQAAVQAFDLLPGSEQSADDRDDLLVARVEALARAGRGQTVLDVVDAGLLDAVREGRMSAAGRLAAALLRAAGAWPWVSYGEDPGPLLERLAGLEPFVASDRTAHARVLAALAVGSCYHPDSSVPDAMSSTALTIARELDDPDVIADALLGRILLYSGVATHSHESVRLIDELFALPHRQSRFDDVIAHAAASMTQMNLADVDAAVVHVRHGITGCDLLRLPVLRVQLRWMEATLAAWRGDFEETRRQYDTARQIHLQTELYTAGSADLAAHTLEWEHGSLGDADPGIVEPDSWSIAIAGARGDRAVAVDEIARWSAKGGPFTWTTLGHQTLIARVVADLGLVEYAEMFIDLLAPFHDRIATVGQVGVIGSVAEVAARLHAMLGRTEAAVALLAQAEDIATRTSSPPTLLRCRLLRAQLCAASPERDRAIAEIADEAQRVGMLALAAYARSIAA
ncbi:BTAD domain-containing putative transcriptional regulator [Rhodococcus sp. AG1013]|uniref:BTAD domain-containing putative transcriptional regulator n=1 Tax=unclassified Rhodococcus (in: high G+C Gram-positive bacteria) TaxID=192944 RepID=UPI000E09E202|nr:BTAD domain-containing putative transcriptional regulator [Rhodococcus sp. AG1013]RDI31398.1 SARP family transcriptional regulator [Rhodococcus sp. AG1013]